MKDKKLDMAKNQHMIRIGKYTLEGGGACPEQYYVFDENEKEVGYIRLRHGNLSAEVFGKIVYRAQPKGDGCFEEDEKDFFLERCVDYIDNNLK